MTWPQHRSHEATDHPAWLALLRALPPVLVGIAVALLLALLLS